MAHAQSRRGSRRRAPGETAWRQQREGFMGGEGRRADEQCDGEDENRTSEHAADQPSRFFSNGLQSSSSPSAP